MFHGFVDAVLHFISLHPHLSLLIVFLIAFIEALPILGTIFPGSVTMTAIGTLLGSGVLPAGTTISVAIFGAFIGDFLGYKLGMHYDGRLRNIWPFKTHPQWLNVGEEFFKKHGGKSIIIGRFIGPVRSTIPLIAGVMKVKLWVFLVAGFSSAILWAGLYILPGFLLGALSLELPQGKAYQFLFVGIVIIFGAWFTFWSLQHFLKFIAKRTDHLIKIVWDRFSANPGLKHIIVLISNKTHPADHLPLTRLLLATLCFLLFGIVAINVATAGFLTDFNKPLFHLLQSFHTPILTSFFSGITALGEGKFILAIALTLSLYLLIFKRSRTGWYFLLIAFLSAGSVEFFKILLHNPRPTGLTLIDHGFSFPSGHTLLSTTILGFLAFTVAHQYKRAWYWMPYTATAIVLLLVAISRLFLGAHWLTDVVGSVLLGASILLVVIISYAHHQDQNAHLGKWWPVISVCIVLLFWTASIIKDVKKTVNASQPVFQQVQTKVQEWWQNPDYYSPKYYLNRLGKPIAPFNLQWEGSLEEIKTFLEKKEWHELHHPITIRNLLKRLTNKNPEHHTPLLTPLYNNARPALVLFKHLPDTDTIVELRLWQANVEFPNHSETLWLGVVYYHLAAPKLLSNPNKNLFITYEENDALHEVTPALGTEWQWRIIHVQPTKHNKSLDNLKWTGNVLLVRKHVKSPRKQAKLSVE